MSCLKPLKAAQNPTLFYRGVYKGGYTSTHFCFMLVAFLVSDEQTLFLGNLDRLCSVLALRRKIIERHVVILVLGEILKHSKKVRNISDTCEVFVCIMLGPERLR